MTQRFLGHLTAGLRELREAGLYKDERLLQSPQRGLIQTSGGEVLNLCANNYLGWADHPALVAAAGEALRENGFGMASVRFICGTQEGHRELERQLARFLGTDDAILFSSCFDANAGLFEALLTAEDAIFSDALNHASIIDGVRLCKAQRFRYGNNDLTELERQLQGAGTNRFRLICTDGVFSMDGILADLPGLKALAERYDAELMVDDSHAVGCVGATGAGTPEHHGLHGQVDILTGTFGKALGGASGGYVAAHQPIVDWLRNRARPYLFSNSLAPPIVAATLRAVDMATAATAERDQLAANAAFFRREMAAAGFELAGADHPIIPVMVGEATLAARFAEALLAEGIYVIAFSYPVVPKGAARIRTQMSAAHTREQLERAVEAFARVGRKLGIIAAS